MLPYASEYLTDLAADALKNNLFGHDLTDQFLTMLAMDDQQCYDGDGDFGTLSRIDLDDELGVVLTILDGIGWGSDRDGTTDEWTMSNLLSHYAQNDVMLGWGGDQKWWADWYPCKSDEAEKEQAEFAARYSEFLGEEE